MESNMLGTNNSFKQNAFNLLGVAFDVVVLLFNLLPVAPGIGFAVVGRIHTDTRGYLFNPWPGADIVVLGLVDQIELAFGKADIKREGTDVTLISYSKPMRMVLAAADELETTGISAEVIDLRSLRPLDEETLYRSVRKTNRAVIIDEAWPVASVGSHVAWLISKNCFDDLDAPVELVASEDVPMPYNHRLELAVQPTVEKIVAAAKSVSYKE